MCRYFGGLGSGSLANQFDTFPETCLSLSREFSCFLGRADICIAVATEFVFLTTWRKYSRESVSLSRVSIVDGETMAPITATCSER